MPAIGAAQAIKEQLDRLMSDKQTLEQEIEKSSNDPTINDYRSKKARIDSQLYGCREERDWFAGTLRKRVHDTCRDDTSCMERPWIDGSGNIWCSKDSTNWYNTASVEINKNEVYLTAKRAKLSQIDNLIKEKNDQLSKYANTPTGKQEVKDLGEINQIKADIDRAKVEAEAEKQRVQLRIESNKKKFLWGTIILVTLIVIGVLIWWIKKRKKK